VNVLARLSVGVHKSIFFVLFVLDADDGVVKRRDAARKKDGRKDRKDKGYVMFEEEDSEEELVADDGVKYAIAALVCFTCEVLNMTVSVECGVFKFSTFCCIC